MFLLHSLLSPLKDALSLDYGFYHAPESTSLFGAEHKGRSYYFQKHHFGRKRTSTCTHCTVLSCVNPYTRSPFYWFHTSGQRRMESLLSPTTTSRCAMGSSIETKSLGAEIGRDSADICQKRLKQSFEADFGAAAGGGGATKIKPAWGRRFRLRCCLGLYMY